MWEGGGGVQANPPVLPITPDHTCLTLWASLEDIGALSLVAWRHDPWQATQTDVMSDTTAKACGQPIIATPTTKGRKGGRRQFSNPTIRAGLNDLRFWSWPFLCPQPQYEVACASGGQLSGFWVWRFGGVFKTASSVLGVKDFSIRGWTSAFLSASKASTLFWLVGDQSWVLDSSPTSWTTLLCCSPRDA